MAETGELVLVAPATADIIGKYAHGIADDLLFDLPASPTVAPVILAPAMETNMYTNPIVQSNMARLKALELRSWRREHGVLAKRQGRAGTSMAEPEHICGTGH